MLPSSNDADRRGWTQANCSLFPDVDRMPYIPWAEIREAVQEWRAQGLFRRFWFVRKPPGLRLRFEAMPGNAGLDVALSQWLTHCERKNAIRGFRFSIYEPETHRFGGAGGMDVAHDLFDNGAAIALGHHAEPKGITALELSLAITTDLLTRSLDDKAEIWDVWCRLCDTVRSAANPERTEEPRWSEALLGLPFLVRAYDDSSTVRAIEETHVRAAANIRALADSGLLGVGPRGWLAAVTVFEWNRLGLPDDPTSLANAMCYMKRVFAPDAAAPAE